MPVSRFHLALFLVLLGLGQAETRAAPSLIERSPFLPPDFQVPGTASEIVSGPPPTASHLQFRGVFALNGEVKVNFYNSRTNQGVWVPVQGRVDGFEVVSYNAATRSVTLDVNGQPSQFELAKPGDTPIPVDSGAEPSRRAQAAAVARAAARGNNSNGTPTIRRRTIVPPRATTIRRPSNRGIPARPVVRPSGDSDNASDRSNQSNSTNRTNQYVNPRLLHRQTGSNASGSPQPQR